MNALRLTKSDFREPVNIGSDEMVSMNEMAEIVLSFEDRKLPIHHIPGPEGVRGRNSDNTLIKEKLGWAPTMRLKVTELYVTAHDFPSLKFSSWPPTKWCRCFASKVNQWDICSKFKKKKKKGSPKLSLSLVIA